MIKKIFQPRLKLLPGTRLTSFLFIGASVLIAGAILFAANIYYNLDTGEIVMEEIQRVTNVIRATAGLIIGGTASQNPSSGYVFEVVGQSKLATTTIATGPLQVNSGFIYGANDEYLRLGVTNDKFEVVKGGSQYEVCDTSGNCVGQGVGLGGYGSPGQVAFWTGSTTLSGSNNLFWATSTNRLGILTNAPDYPLDVRGTIRTGGPGVSGQLRIYSEQGTTDYELVFAATSTMTTTTIYYFPPNYGGPNYVLTTDGSGNLIWQSVSGVGGLTGSGTQNRLAKWTATQSLGDASILDNATTVIITLTTATTTISNVLDPNQVDAFTLIGNITGSGTPNITGIGTFAGNIAQLASYLQVPIVKNVGGNLTLQTQTSGDIILDPASGKILLGSSAWIETSQGYQIGKSGTQVLREMVPIFGFDLPVKTATTTYVKISRDIVNYPLNPCATGTTRVHKLVIRYGATATSTWQVATSTTGGYAEITVPPTGATSTGSVYTISTSIPTPSGSCTGWTQGTETDDWWVRMKLNATGEIMIYQIFLAAYDQIQ
jgi:hypothetical protein